MEVEIVCIVECSGCVDAGLTALCVLCLYDLVGTQSAVAAT